MPDAPNLSHLPPPKPRVSVAPSLNFLLVALAFTGLGAAMWHGWIGGRFAVLAFVVAGWVASLCLHEFGHAIVAYRGGDYAVARSGYLTLDPLRYTDVGLSIVLPLAMIFIGGFGLPGGAIFINTNRLRSRAWHVAVAAAGPAMNLAFLLLLALLYQAAPHAEMPTSLEAGIAVLALFQATAIVLNLLPLPGLDGFAMLMPFLSPAAAARANSLGAIGLVLLFLLIWLTPLGAALIRLGVEIAGALGIPFLPVAVGFGAMKLL